MKSFQKIILLLAGLFILGTETATAIAADALSVPTKKVQSGTEFLFIETAKSGVMQKDKNQDDTYLITLNDVDPWVTYFSNVPKRITGFMNMHDFQQLLASETKTKYQAGLNSGLIAHTTADPKPKDKMVRYILSIKDPQYNVAAGSITFTAKIVPGAQKNPIPTDVNLYHISLFIDAICASCSGDGF